MTTDFDPYADTSQEILPDELLAARDRVAQGRAKAARTIGRARNRHRVLPSAIVGSALLVTAGLADRFVQSTLTHATAAVTTTTTLPATSSNAAALAKVTRTLAADQQAITALAKAQSQLARSAAGDGGSVSLPNVVLPSLPSLPPVPSIAPISSPTVATPAPTTHATTGASVVVP